MMEHVHNTRNPFLKGLKIAGFVLVGIGFAALLALVFGLLVQYIWNWLMPDLFGLKTITYLQAFALVVLSKILFGSFGKHHDHGDHPGPPWLHRKCRGRKKLPEEVVKNMDDYEKYWKEEGRDAFNDFLKRSGNKDDNGPG